MTIARPDDIRVFTAPVKITVRRGDLALMRDALEDPEPELKVRGVRRRKPRHVGFLVPRQN